MVAAFPSHHRRAALTSRSPTHIAALEPYSSLQNHMRYRESASSLQQEAMCLVVLSARIPATNSNVNVTVHMSAISLLRRSTCELIKQGQRQSWKQIWKQSEMTDRFEAKLALAKFYPTQAQNASKLGSCRSQSFLSF